MLTVETSGAALVGGRTITAEALVNMKKVKIVRPFYFNRQLLPKEKVVELPELFVLEMLAAKKCELVEETGQVSVPVKVDEKKGGRDAGK